MNRSQLIGPALPGTRTGNTWDVNEDEDRNRSRNRNNENDERRIHHEGREIIKNPGFHYLDNNHLESII